MTWTGEVRDATQDRQRTVPRGDVRVAELGGEFLLRADLVLGGRSTLAVPSEPPQRPGGQLMIPGQPEEETMSTTWNVNITTAERVARVVVGLVGVVGGAYLLGGASSAVAVVLELLLIVAGLDLVVTGATGHCPLYQRLGHVPDSMKAGRS